MVVALGTYPVEKFSAGAQVKAKVQVIGCLTLLVRDTSRKFGVGNGPRNNRAK